MVVSIYLPTCSARGGPFLHTLSRIVCRFSDDGNSDYNGVIPNRDLSLVLWEDLEEWDRGQGARKFQEGGDIHIHTAEQKLTQHPKAITLKLKKKVSCLLVW